MSRSSVQPGMRSPWVMRSGDMPNLPHSAPPPARQRGRDARPTEVFDPHRYARLVGEQTIAVAIVAPGTRVLTEPDTRRNMLLLRNASATANVYVSFGNEASLNSPIILTPGQMVLFDTVVPQDDVFAFADAAAAFITVAQSVIPY